MMRGKIIDHSFVPWEKVKEGGAGSTGESLILFVSGGKGSRRSNYEKKKKRGVLQEKICSSTHPAKKGDSASCLRPGEKEESLSDGSRDKVHCPGSPYEYPPTKGRDHLKEGNKESSSKEKEKGLWSVSSGF